MTAGRTIAPSTSRAHRAAAASVAGAMMLAAGALACAAEIAPADAAQRLPRDAARVAERSATCVHFAGEFNGDRSTRDAEVTAAMAEHGCDTIERDVVATRRRYADNAAVIDALDRAEQP